MRHYLYGLGQTGPEEGEGVPQPAPAPAPPPIYMPPAPAPRPAAPVAHAPLVAASVPPQVAGAERLRQVVVVGNAIQRIRANEKLAETLRARAFSIDSDDVAQRKFAQWQRDMQTNLKAQLESASTPQDRAWAAQQIEQTLSPQALESKKKYFESEAEAAVDQLNEQARSLESDSREASRALQDKYGVEVFRSGFKAAIQAGNQAVTASAVLNISE